LTPGSCGSRLSVGVPGDQAVYGTGPVASGPHAGTHRTSRLAQATVTAMKDSGEVRQQGISARRRAALAKQRELAAHQRAIELHERAAELQERLGYPDRAANARQHAEHARQLLAKGREEQREQEP
jgi:hypothetical protein